MRYARPPITEAVIEARFEGGLSARELDRISTKLKRDYPAVDDLKTIGIQIKGSTITPEVTQNGFRRRSESGTDVVLLQNTGIATCRLAPYASWDHLWSSVQKNLAIAKSVAGRQKMRRVSARYLNRIDIPTSGNSATLQDYVAVASNFPAGQYEPRNENSRLEFVDIATGFTVVIHSGVEAGVLIDHLSFSLDIDVICNELIDGDEISSEFEQIHEAKNRIFESCITDAARRLFD